MPDRSQGAAHPFRQSAAIADELAILSVSAAQLEFFDLVKRWTTPPDALVLDVATKYWQSEVTYALAALGVADELFEAG
eukprot:CAMPEP_0183574100 /NCGR_PEP_ID=MMETSP0371-20130417/132611_1 /TAXON_ID=268820 /ORGANISM="Peridinium aciculiferum, Strain PAER-2" /LENGTH=78 /DNA_ID=CAMNT_0025784141 /DNA_START=37 /DNA_END=270 /DNA_ORIENTATION=+